MTTFTLTGIRFVEDGAQTVAVSTATLTTITTDNFLFQYSFTAPVQPGEPAEIDFSSARGDTYSATMTGGGVTASPSAASVTQITWGGGNVSQVLILDYGDAQASYAVFQLGGATLPAITTAAAANSFYQSISAISGDFGGAFGANTPIDLRDLAALSGLTENDVFIIDGSNDSLVGKVIRTGIGHDKVIAIGTNDEIELGSGNDTAKGGNGNDTISGGTGQDNLVGGNGADFLKGGLGDDVLNGGTGKDQLLGAGGADRFVFASGHGTDTILDFENDIDLLRFSTTLGVETVEQALAAAIEFGNNVIFSFGGSNVLTVISATKAQLADDIVIF